MVISRRKSEVSITIQGQARSVKAKAGDTLLESFIQQKVKIDHSCEGMGSCGTCRIFVEEGMENLSERTEIELEMGADRGFAKNERLSCQTEAHGNIRVRIPKSSTD